MRLVIVVCVLVSALFFVAPTFAQVEEITAKVGTVVCGACFKAAEMSLTQTEGVASVTSDVENGTFQIRIKERKGVSLKDVTGKVRMAGLGNSPQFEIQARGKLQTKGNRTVLVVPFQNETIVVDTQEKAEHAARLATENSDVLAAGTLEGQGDPFTLHLKRLQKQ